MKRWRKRLTLFSLLAAGCLIWNLSGVRVKAEEAVPQITLKMDPIEKKINGVMVNVSVENVTLTQADFVEKNVYDPDKDKEDDDGTYYIHKNSECIIGGKIIMEVVPGQTSSKLKGAGTYFDEDEFEVNVNENATISWLTGTNNDYEEMADLDWFYLPTESDKSGLLALISWNGKNYVVNFPVEVKCTDYLDAFNADTKILAKYKDSTQYKYVESPYNTSFANNTFTITADSYNTCATADAFIPSLAYGANLVNSTELMVNGEKKKVVRTPDLGAIAKYKDGYSFEVKNMQGQIATYKIIVDTPWQLDIASQKIINEYSPAVSINNESKQGSTFNNVKEGESVKITFNVPAKKKLKAITVEHVTESGAKNVVYELNYTINGNSVKFVMPRDEVIISGVELENDFSTDVRKITAAPKVEDGEETDFAIIETKVDGVEKSTATEHQTITLTAKEMYATYTSLCGYKFDHWESNSDSLIITDEQKNISPLTFYMPDEDVKIQAVYRRTGVPITAGISNAIVGNISLGNSRVGAMSSTSKNVSKVTELCRAGETYNISLSGANFKANRFLGWVDEADIAIAKENTNEIQWVDATDVKTGVAYYYPIITVTDQTQHMTFIASFEAKTACTLTFTSSDENKGTVSASVDGASIKSGDNTIYDGDVVTLKAEKKTGYKFAGWKVTSPADVSVTFEDANAEETTFTMPKITSGTLTIQGVFEVDPAYLSPDCELTKVELLKQDGTLVKQANRSGTTFTIRLSAEDMTAEEARNIASGGYLLRLTYPETATAAMKGGMKDGDSGAALWRTGISNSIGMGGSGTFTITAKRSEFKNTYTIAMEYDDRPVLKAGTVKRISDTEASVGFRSSSAGTYYWAVVDAGEAKPDIPTNVAGTTFKYADRENTIKLTSLTAGAKDIYIVVKNDNDSANVKISDVLKISIPAFGGTETTYKVNVTGNLPGGKVAVDKTEAKAGETVTVTVTPDSGKKMTANSLIYSQSSAPYEVVHIDEKTKQFTMPAYDLSVSCRFEDENSSTTPDATTTGKIGAFVVNGVSGTVDNTTGMITVTLPNGTDLNSLAPVITISGAKSISPASGAIVNLSSPVTYTLTLEDGTTKTYTVRAYVEGPSKSDQLWNDMLNNVDGSPDHSGSKTWWKKAKDLKKHNDYPEYW